MFVAPGDWTTSWPPLWRPEFRSVNTIKEAGHPRVFANYARKLSTVLVL